MPSALWVAIVAGIPLVWVESGHLHQAAVSEAASDKANASRRVHDGIGLDGSDSSDADDTNSVDSFVYLTQDSFAYLAEDGMNAAVDRVIRAGHALDKQDSRGTLALGLRRAKDMCLRSARCCTTASTLTSKTSDA